MPHCAAVVAAPIRKLWPAYLSSSVPAVESASLTFATKRSRVSGLPSRKWNSGPVPPTLMDKYANIADIGHSSLLVRPMYMSTPFLKGSVLEALIRTCMVEGLAGLSIAMSGKDRWAPGS